MFSSDSDIQPLQRHPDYYINGGDLYLVVEQYQFRVHRYFFERESAFFRGRLTSAVAPGTTRHGTDAPNPLVIEGVRAEDFSKFLWVFYNPKYSIYVAPAEDWAAILAQSQRWGFAEVKALCVRELESLWLPDIDKIVLYQDNDVDRNLLLRHYAALCAREDPLNFSEGFRLGLETSIMIARARECARAPLNNGLRSPSSPNITETELYGIIQDLFSLSKSDPQGPNGTSTGGWRSADLSPPPTPLRLTAVASPTVALTELLHPSSPRMPNGNGLLRPLPNPILTALPPSTQEALSPPPTPPAAPSPILGSTHLTPPPPPPPPLPPQIPVEQASSLPTEAPIQQNPPLTPLADPTISPTEAEGAAPKKKKVTKKGLKKSKAAPPEPAQEQEAITTPTPTQLPPPPPAPVSTQEEEIPAVENLSPPSLPSPPPPEPEPLTSVAPEPELQNQLEERKEDGLTPLLREKFDALALAEETNVIAGVGEGGEGEGVGVGVGEAAPEENKKKPKPKPKKKKKKVEEAAQEITQEVPAGPNPTEAIDGQLPELPSEAPAHTPTESKSIQPKEEERHEKEASGAVEVRGEASEIAVVPIDSGAAATKIPAAIEARQLKKVSGRRKYIPTTQESDAADALTPRTPLTQETKLPSTTADARPNLALPGSPSKADGYNNGGGRSGAITPMNGTEDAEDELPSWNEVLAGLEGLSDDDDDDEEGGENVLGRARARGPVSTMSADDLSFYGDD